MGGTSPKRRTGPPASTPLGEPSGNRSPDRTCIPTAKSLRTSNATAAKYARVAGSGLLAPSLPPPSPSFDSTQTQLLPFTGTFHQLTLFPSHHLPPVNFRLKPLLVLTLKAEG